jgi:hypothetical protein
MAMNMSRALSSTRRNARNAKPRGRSQPMCTSPSMNIMGKASPSKAIPRARRTALCGAVAANHVAKGGVLHLPVGTREPHRDALLGLVQVVERNAALDRDAEAIEMTREQALGFVLRQAELGVGQVGKIEIRIARRMAVND